MMCYEAGSCGFEGLVCTRDTFFLELRDGQTIRDILMHIKSPRSVQSLDVCFGGCQSLADITKGRAAQRPSEQPVFVLLH
jgi:hypothetical protein